MASRMIYLFLLLLVCTAPCLEGRRLLLAEGGKRISSQLDAGLFLSALPKGRVPPSSPSKKGHAMVVDQKLLAMHFAKLDRLLKAVPSPGVGH